jgi:hypothetical protein
VTDRLEEIKSLYGSEFYRPEVIEDCFDWLILEVERLRDENADLRKQLFVCAHDKAALEQYRARVLEVLEELHEI